VQLRRRRFETEISIRTFGSGPFHRVVKPGPRAWTTR